MLLKYGFPILAALALALAVTSVKRMTPVDAHVAPPSPPPVAAFANQVGAVGLVEPASENIAVSLPVPGLVTAVLVKAGDYVHKGQPLFSLDDRDLRAELTLRQSAAELAQAKLTRLESSPRPEEIPPAEARVGQAQAQLSDAQTQLQMIEAVRDKRAIKEEDVQRRRRAVEVAQARLQEAQSQLTLLKAGTWRPDLDVARAEVKQSLQQVARLQADLGRLIVTAPIDGQILQCKVRPGEYAQAGVLAQALMLMGDVRRLHVRADIDEKDAWRVQPGVKAVASVRGNAATRYPLEYVRLEPYVVPKRNLTGDATERVDTRVLQAIYRLPVGVTLHPGQQMDLSIEAGQGGR